MCLNLCYYGLGRWTEYPLVTGVHWCIPAHIPWFNLKGIQFATEWEVDITGSSSLRTLLFQAEVSRQTYLFISFQVNLVHKLSVLQAIMPWSSIFSVNYYHRCLFHGRITEVGQSHSLCIGVSTQVKHLKCLGFLSFPINGFLLYFCREPMCTSLSCRHSKLQLIY